MKQKSLGVLQLGHENVELFIFPEGEGGEFYFVPDQKSVPRIKIGINYTRWDDVVAVLLHEALEFALCRSMKRYIRSGKLNGDQADYIFVLDHSEFGNICSAAAMFLVDALPRVAREWGKRTKKR